MIGNKDASMKHDFLKHWRIMDKQSPHLKLVQAEDISKQELSFFAQIKQGSSSSEITQRYYKLKHRYFTLEQQQNLAGFLACKTAYSIDELLLLSVKNVQQKAVLSLLRGFLSGRYDAVKTVRYLDSLLNELIKPWWQLWQIPNIKRLSYLKRFVENFKEICLKEVMNENLGFAGSTQVFAHETLKITPKSVAANQHHKLRLISRTAQECAQAGSLFLQKKETELAFSSIVPNTNQVKSFFLSKE